MKCVVACVMTCVYLCMCYDIFRMLSGAEARTLARSEVVIHFLFEARTKWRWFYRRHFSDVFSWKEAFLFWFMFRWSLDSIDNGSALVNDSAQNRRQAEPKVSQITAAFLHHQVSVGYHSVVWILTPVKHIYIIYVYIYILCHRSNTIWVLHTLR